MLAAMARARGIPARVCSLVAPCEFPPEEYFASLPFPMLAAPGSRVLKLPSLPRSLELALRRAKAEACRH